jgi:hypothetical protein
MKPNMMIKTGLSAIAFLIGLSGCGGGGSSSNANGPEVAQTTLKIVVQDEAAAPVATARVRIAGADLTTDASGAATAILPNNDTTEIALVTKAGYATNAKTAVVYSGKASELRVTLFPHQNVSTFAANAGITVTPGGAKVQIPAAAGFRTAAGAAYTGIVTISSSYFNPETLRGLQGFAAPYTGSDGGNQSSLISVGVIEAKFSAADGSALEMTNAAAATLTFPPTGNSGTLTTVPLWYYDEAAKIWVREGEAARQADGSYVGTVRHFTVWNADIRVTNPATIKGCFRNAQGQPVSPVFARVTGIGWSASGGAGADGNFEIRNAPSGIPLELQVTNPASASVSVAPLNAGEVRQLDCVVLASPATSFVIPAVGSFPGITITLPILTTTPPTATPTTPVVTSTAAADTPTTPSVTPTTTSAVPVATPTTTSTTASFAGTYAGTYGGVEVGTFNVTISSLGVVTGNVVSQTFNGQVFPVSGQVGSNGQVSLTATGQAGSSNFLGSISSGGVVSGNWGYGAPLTGGGTFTGQRQMLSANAALITQYVGTWRESCQALAVGSTDIVFTIASPTNLGASVTAVSRYYASANCSGSTVATITDRPDLLVATGTKNIGAQSVVKVDITIAAGAPAITGSASLVSEPGGFRVDVSINSIVVESTSYFLTARTLKTVFSQVGNGSTFLYGEVNNTALGVPAPVDAEGYPQLLDASSLATRQ